MATRRTSHAKSSTKRSSAGSSPRSSGNRTYATKTYATKSGRRSTTPPSRRWSAKVKTDSTKPAPGLFKKSAKEIAHGLEKKSVSPEGPGQAMRMLSFYENRGGKNLSAERKHALEKAKALIREKEDNVPAAAKRSRSTHAQTQSGSSSGSASKRGSSRTSSSTSQRKPSAAAHSRRSSGKAS